MSGKGIGDSLDALMKQMDDKKASASAPQNFQSKFSIPKIDIGKALEHSQRPISIGRSKIETKFSEMDWGKKPSDGKSR